MHEQGTARRGGTAFIWKWEQSVGSCWVKGIQPEPDHIYRAKEEETDMERNDTTRNARIAKGEVLSGAFGKYVAE